MGEQAAAVALGLPPPAPACLSLLQPQPPCLAPQPLLLLVLALAPTDSSPTLGWGTEHICALPQPSSSGGDAMLLLLLGQAGAASMCFMPWAGVRPEPESRLEVCPPTASPTACPAPHLPLPPPAPLPPASLPLFPATA